MCYFIACFSFQYPQEFLQREETLASHRHVEQMHFVLKEILQRHVLASKIILEIHMLHVDQNAQLMQTAPLIKHVRGYIVLIHALDYVVSMLSAELSTILPPAHVMRDMKETPLILVD